MQLTGFQGRTAFVTGAAGGIGQSLVTSLRDAGARVFATDIPEALATLAPTDDAETIWRPLDVRDAAAVTRSMAEADRFGPVTLGIHAAGIVSNLPILDTSAEEWQRVIDINAGGTFNVTRAMASVMVPRKQGAIVAVSSNAAGIPRMNMGAYAASKAAATMFVRCLGLELATHGIRCNILAPGSTLTPMQTGMWADENGAAKIIAGDPASFRTGIPLAKLATAQDIASSAMFLLSDQAGHITMSDLYIDGGATLRG